MWNSSYIRSLRIASGHGIYSLPYMEIFYNKGVAVRGFNDSFALPIGLKPPPVTHIPPALELNSNGKNEEFWAGSFQ